VRPPLGRRLRRLLQPPTALRRPRRSTTRKPTVTNLPAGYIWALLELVENLISPDEDRRLHTEARRERVVHGHDPSQELTSVTLCHHMSPTVDSVTIRHPSSPFVTTGVDRCSRTRPAAAVGVMQLVCAARSVWVVLVAWPMPAMTGLGCG
jgi:hypothetical protein